ncbi:MAG TPA: type II secretion system F family protein [Abditibacteriaceae bacterium]|jgi:type II secretory pathway component PulF
MPTFAYQARNQAGERVAGTSEAPDQRTALESLRESGLFVTQLAPAGRATSGRAASGRAASRSTAVSGAVTQSAVVQGAVAQGAVAQGTVAQRMAPRSAPVPEVAAMPRPPHQQPQEGHRLEQGQTIDVEFSEAGAASPQPGASSSAAPSPAVELVAPGAANQQIWLHASAKDLSLFYRQMNAMLHAGTSLWHALRTLGEHASSKSLRQASREMANRLESGATWSQTMHAYPGLFSELAIGMVQAGEAGGFLDRMCLKLSEYSERDYELQQTIKRETWYPKLLVFCAILIPSVVPVVIAGVGGTSMWRAWFSSGAPYALMLIGMMWLGWKVMNRVSPAVTHGGSPRLWIDWLKLKLPIIGKTSRALATVKFCRALGALYSAGVGPHKAVKMAADACGNAAMAEKARSITRDLENGAGLTASLAKTQYFPGVALQMMRTGEESGNLDGQLDKVADFLEQDAETTIRQSVKVLGIVVFLGIAAYIGAMVIQFYVGYFNQIFTEAGG